MAPPAGGNSRRQVNIKTEPEDDHDNPLITLKVLDQEGRRALHTMRMMDKMQGLMDAYYKKAAGDVAYGTGTFMFDGSVRLRGSDTPAELELEDGDEIDFFPLMSGGGGWVDSNAEEKYGDGGGGLPEDQVFELLTRVPLDDLPACRMVSTRWLRLTYEPAFAPLHCRRAAAVSGYLVQSMSRHNRYHADFVSMHASPRGAAAAISLDFLPSAQFRVEAVSAHCGLVCCIDYAAAAAPRRPRYYMCKPATRQWRALPNPRLRFRMAAVAMVARPSAASANAVEFKVVRFSVPARRDRLLCEVFDSRRFAWRRAPDVRLCPESLFQLASPAVRAQGAMHWLRWPDRLTGAQDVFAFDFRAEKCRVIPLPREVDERDDPWARKWIAAVEGRLCLLVLTDPAGTVDEEVLEVWEMASYGEGGWKKKMAVSLKSLHAKEGAAVFLKDLHSSDIAFFTSFYRVMWYDLRKGKMAEVQVKHGSIEEIFKYESDLIPCRIGSGACRSPDRSCMF